MKILLIDHHALFRDGLRLILQQLPGKIGGILEAGSFPDGMRLAGQHPDIGLALLELKSPGSEGTISVEFFHRHYPHIPLVVVSCEADRRTIVSALNRGASGYVCKSSTGQILLNALKLALSGSIHVPAEVLQRPGIPARNKDKGRDNRSSGADEYGLTARQREILGYLAVGLSNKEIAATAGLAEGTVKGHVAAVLQTLRAKNRVEAVRIARRLGLAGCTGPDATADTMQTARSGGDMRQGAATSCAE